MSRKGKYECEDGIDEERWAEDMLDVEPAARPKEVEKRPAGSAPAPYPRTYSDEQAAAAREGSGDE